MPTGYTAKLYEGEEQSFPEFAMSCARAFGALVTMRDESADAPIPDEFRPSTYDAEKLAEAEARLAEVASWDDGRVWGEYQHELGVARAARERLRAKAEETVARYREMLAEVEAWEPPTEEHRGLKTFMADQLFESIRFDSYSGDYPSDPFAATPPDYRDQLIAKAQRDIDYHAENHAKEVERAESRTAWVRELRASLEDPA